ncbi:MAG: glycosyltransferase family 4 protein [Chloroflexota bacterium]
MRIAQISPLWERVPPPAYGGTEAVVHALTEGLVARGHEVVLFASGDSLTSAELRSVYPRSLRTAVDLKDPTPYDWLHVAQALAASGEFDVVHNHAGELPMAMSHLVATPMLSTLHCLITPDTKIVWDHYEGFYNTISLAARRTIPEDLENANFVGVVYNGIDVASFPFRADKEEHLLFLSRVAPEKGTHLAIEVARRLGIHLVLAGKVDRADREYFRTVVEPLIDGNLITYIGEVSREKAKELYAAARALLLPIQWEEPFGLVMPEAMATGTPVIAFRRGAAPELIVDGETGFLVEDGDVEGMAEAVGKIGMLDPRHIRHHVEKHFDVSQMVDGYLNMYERVLFQAKRRATILRPLRPEQQSQAMPTPSQGADGDLREVS